MFMKEQDLKQKLQPLYQALATVAAVPGKFALLATTSKDWLDACQNLHEAKKRFGFSIRFRDCSCSAIKRGIERCFQALVPDSTDRLYLGSCPGCSRVRQHQHNLDVAFRRKDMVRSTLRNQLWSTYWSTLQPSAAEHIQEVMSAPSASFVDLVRSVPLPTISSVAVRIRKRFFGR